MGGGGGYGDQEPLGLPKPLTDLLTIIRTSPLRPSQPPGNEDCFALLDQEEQDFLIWWERVGQYHL